MIRNVILLVIIILIRLIPSQGFAQTQLDIQGHRGARGLMPENTIPAFIKALDLGVTTLEMDVVITGSGDVIVSHEPYFNSKICLDPEGKEIKSSTEKDHNIFKMSTEDVQKYDCGSLGNPGYPEQKKIEVSKPLLSEVIAAAEAHIKSKTGYFVSYNIELKSDEKEYGESQPSPAEFSKIVYKVIDANLPWDRVIIQCFDFKVLQYWHETYPDVTLAALVANMKSIDNNLEDLGFTPDIYSPYYKLMNATKVEKLHGRNIKVIPWTVNDPKDMKVVVSWGVDGLITDYPDRSKELGFNVNIPYLK